MSDASPPDLPPLPSSVRFSAEGRTERYKQFTGVPRDLVEKVLIIHHRQKGQNPRTKYGDIYGEALTALMNRADTGKEVIYLAQSTS